MTRIAHQTCTAGLNTGQLQHMALSGQLQWLAPRLYLNREGDGLSTG